MGCHLCSALFHECGHPKRISTRKNFSIGYLYQSHRIYTLSMWSISKHRQFDNRYLGTYFRISTANIEWVSVSTTSDPTKGKESPANWYEYLNPTIIVRRDIRRKMTFKKHRNKERNGTAGTLGGTSINFNFSTTTKKERKRNTGTENLLARKPYQSEKIINYPRLLLLLSPPPPLLATVCLLHVPWTGEFQDLFSWRENPHRHPFATTNNLATQSV